MAIYFIDSEQKPIIKYIDLHTSRTDTGFLAETKYQLDMDFILTSSAEIKSDISENKVIGYSSSLALLDVICELIFEIEDTGEQKRIILNPIGNSRFYLNGNTSFSAPIDPRNAEDLNTWRKGRTLLVKWSIRGQVAVTDSDQFFPILMINASNKNDSRSMLPSLDSGRFMSSILNPVGLSHTFLEVFPLEIPVAIKNAAGLPTGIGGLTADLFTLEEHLNNAVDVLRNARTSYDYRHIMDEVKTALENIAAYPSKRELGKELLVQTSVISNVDSSAGGDAAAVEVITKFLQLLDSAYWIASKPAHVKLKGKSAPRFGMSPDRTDAVFVLTVGLAAFKFLIERIELYIKTVH